MVSLARVRLDPRKSVRPFKGIFCDDISEFESSHPSQAVPFLWGIPSLQKYMRHPRGFASVTESLTSNFLNFGRKPAHFHATAGSNLHETGLRARADGTHARPADPHQAGTGFNSLRGLNTEPVESRVASALGPGCIP